MTSNTSPPSLKKSTIAFIWLILLLVTTIVFNTVLDKINNPNQRLTMTTNEFGDHQLVLERNRYGHYLASGEINDKPVVFLLDTGATLVAVPEHIANTLRLKKGRPFQSQTANGNSTSYTTTIAKLALGEIIMTNVPASISTGIDFDEILLGMSVLKHLHLTQQGKELRISIPD